MPYQIVYLHKGMKDRLKTAHRQVRQSSCHYINPHEDGTAQQMLGPTHLSVLVISLNETDALPAQHHFQHLVQIEIQADTFGNIPTNLALICLVVGAIQYTYHYEIRAFARNIRAILLIFDRVSFQNHSSLFPQSIPKVKTHCLADPNKINNSGLKQYSFL